MAIVAIKTNDMKKLESQIEIAAPAQKVWDTMTGPETYKEWTNVAWPGSYYKGEWRKGQNIKFLGSSNEGTLATIVECKPAEYMLAKHIAVLKADGTEDRDSKQAQSWIGTTEAYTFREKNGRTELKTEMNVEPEWEAMLGDGWPKALAKLKEICER
jgi:uncharacterized protein YndB with AHSA1/START domain